MIVVRFKAECQPEKTEQAVAAFEIILAELLAAEPEATLFRVSSSEPWGG